MAIKASWQDEYWLLLLQAYLKKPVGLKPLYSREMVDLSLELHISPEQLQRRMRTLDTMQTPRLEKLMARYRGKPEKLRRAASLLRSMQGFGAEQEFYEGVETIETFEKDFRPMPENPMLMPIMLVIILELYFQLTPSTMVAETPEVAELSALMRIQASDVVEVLEMFQHCDPYLSTADVVFDPLLIPCQQVWQRYANGNPTELEQMAGKLKEYFQTQRKA